MLIRHSKKSDRVKSLRKDDGNKSRRFKKEYMTIPKKSVFLFYFVMQNQKGAKSACACYLPPFITSIKEFI